MADKILIWSSVKQNGTEQTILPAYYLDGDFEPVAVRIHAETAPTDGDAEFDIYDDGESIFSDRGTDTTNIVTKAQIVHTPKTTIVLGKDNTEELDEDDFNGNEIVEGSWIICKFPKDGGGRNFTIQLELNEILEVEE